MGCGNQTRGDGLLSSIIAQLQQPYTEVDTFASLPVGASIGDIYFVQQETGSFFSRKQRGLYRWTGSEWEYSGDNTYTAGETSYDNGVSGLTATNVKTALDELANTQGDILTNELACQFSFGRDNKNVTNLWLESGNGISTNLSPIVLPFNTTLVALSGSSRVNGTFTIDVYRNLDVRNGGTPNVANALAILTFSASQSEYLNINVDLNAGDEIGIFCRGTGIDRPSITTYLKRRI